MKFDRSRFTATAKATGFQADNLEKVLRLRELLNEFQKHSFLRGKREDGFCRRFPLTPLRRQPALALTN